MTDALGWRSTMGMLALFALIVLPLAPGLLPESRTPERPRLDVPGAVTVTGGLLSVIYALSTAADRGFGHVDVIATLAAGLALLTAFALVESRTRHRWSPCRCCAAAPWRGATWAVWSPSP